MVGMFTSVLRTGKGGSEQVSKFLMSIQQVAEQKPCVFCPELL